MKLFLNDTKPSLVNRLS